MSIFILKLVGLEEEYFVDLIVMLIIWSDNVDWPSTNICSEWTVNVIEHVR